MNRNFPINRLLWSVTLLALGCALIDTILLWREARSRHIAASQSVRAARLGDDEFARIQTFVSAVKANYAAEKEPKAAVLLADDLLNKARYLHGDIRLEEWRRLRSEAEPELSRLMLARYNAGITVSDGLSYYNDLLQTPR